MSRASNIVTRNLVTRNNVEVKDIEVPSHLFSGLSRILQAYDYAMDLDRAAWDFAVEINDLRSVGLTNSDFRWLIWKGWVQHARERTSPGDPSRQFRPDDGLVFGKRSCFVFTEAGADAARRNAATVQVSPTGPHGNGRTKRAQRSGSALRQNGARRPIWDRDRQQLQVRGRLVKQFKLHSPNQETILMAFEEEGWPPRIDDPLMPQHDIDPKERLRNTIKSLNRKQVHRLIRFMGDGTGQAIRWELIAEDAKNGPDRRSAK